MKKRDCGDWHTEKADHQSNFALLVIPFSLISIKILLERFTYKDKISKWLQSVGGKDHTAENLVNKTLILPQKESLWR